MSIIKEVQRQTHRGLKVQLEMIKLVMHIMFHSNDIEE